MKKLIQEFKEFIARGNVMDMAVGIIVGSAFTAVVTSLVDDIITPLIQLITGGSSTSPSLVVAGIDFGSFIGAIINFLIIALVVFLLIKGINGISAEMNKLSKEKEEEEKAEEPAPTCPYCLEEHKPGATRCPHCGSELK